MRQWNTVSEGLGIEMPRSGIICDALFPFVIYYVIHGSRREELSNQAIP